MASVACASHRSSRQTSLRVGQRVGRVRVARAHEHADTVLDRLERVLIGHIVADEDRPHRLLAQRASTSLAIHRVASPL